MDGGYEPVRVNPKKHVAAGWIELLLLIVTNIQDTHISKGNLAVRQKVHI